MIMIMIMDSELNEQLEANLAEARAIKAEAGRGTIRELSEAVDKLQALADERRSILSAFAAWMDEVMAYGA